MTDEQRTRWSRVAFGTAVVVFLAVIGVQCGRVRDVRAELDRTGAQAEATNARAAQVVEALQSSVDRAIRLIADVRSSTDARGVERRQLVKRLASTQRDLATARTALKTNRRVLRRLSVYGSDLRRCLDGVSEATRAAQARDRARAAAAMEEAKPHCTIALAASSGARYPYDFADPFVLHAGDDYYGYSTNAGAGDIQVIRSSDLDTWETLGNGLGALPAWAAPDATWAPSVLPRPDGYVLYYTVRNATTGLQCVSRAVATEPLGPFVDDSLRPLVCDVAGEGSIDASPFLDADGKPWLVWRNGVNHQTTAIYSAPLSDDGRSFAERLAPNLPEPDPTASTTTTAPSTTTTTSTSTTAAPSPAPTSTAPPRSTTTRPPRTTTTTTPAPLPPGDPAATRLIVADRSWERTLVEGPSMRLVDGRFLLVYAAADWSSDTYTTGYAWCLTPTGPCSKPTDGQILASDDVVAGPGGAEIFDTTDGGLALAYHGYTRGNVGYPNSRYLFVAPLTVRNGTVAVGP